MRRHVRCVTLWLLFVFAARSQNVSCPDGTSWSVSSHLGFGLCVRESDSWSLVDNTWEQTGFWPDCELLAGIARSIGGPLRILDVGAHIGTCAVRYACEGHSVAAFEPHVRSFAQLNASIVANGLVPGTTSGRCSSSSVGGGLRKGYVEAQNIALASTSSRLYMIEKVWNAAANIALPFGADHLRILLSAQNAGVEDYIVDRDASIAMAAPLDATQVFGARPPKGFDLVKIDVNGRESAVLKGAIAAFFSLPEAVQIELNPEIVRQIDGDPAEILHFLLERGYSVWALLGDDMEDSSFRVTGDGHNVLDIMAREGLRFINVLALNPHRWPPRASLRETLGEQKINNK